MKNIVLIFALIVIPFSSAFAGDDKKKKKPFSPKADASTLDDRLHPLCRLENVYPLDDVELKVSAMVFHGDELYLTVFTPDRQNKAPFIKGEVFKVTGLIGNVDRSKIKAHRIMGDLYEPTAITVFADKIYIGEKDKISRLDDRNNDGLYSADEKTVLMDGLSQPNFHTYTIGFETILRDGKHYLAGNFTTSIRLGGARDINMKVNPKVKRGSTFLLGPVTGKETAKEVDISYYAGGYRTPNGFAVGPNQEIIVTDNQGVFNPSNEFIRLTQGGFYGHYLLNEANANIAAFQPDNVDSKIGGSVYQTPPTVHLPQGKVDRSPTQPIILQNLTGSLAVYNGQWLVGDLTLGRINRIFIEEVNGIWQGAAFLHSGGHDPKGETGFTAGPNRIVRGPDNKLYIGHIGHGGLWQFLPRAGEPPKPPYGLQRLSFVSPADIPANFNEMVAVRDIVGGLEVEFFKAITPEQLAHSELTCKQWTYIPTNGYGGPEVGTETLQVEKKELSADGKRLRITMPGIRDNSPPFISRDKYSNQNVGWVIEVQLGKLDLYKDTAWYSMIHHQGGGAKTKVVDDLSPETKPLEYAKAQYTAICAACHSLDGSRLVGPSFKNLFGRQQKVIANGKEHDVTVDDDYLMRAINDPLAEAPYGFPPAMPNLSLPPAGQKAMVEWIKTLK